MISKKEAVSKVLNSKAFRSKGSTPKILDPGINTKDFGRANSKDNTKGVGIGGGYYEALNTTPVTPNRQYHDSSEV